MPLTISEIPETPAISPAFYEEVLDKPEAAGFIYTPKLCSLAAREVLTIG